MTTLAEHRQLDLFPVVVPLALHAFKLYPAGVSLPVWRSDAWLARPAHHAEKPS